MADLRTELQIPDLWFDFYARLVPGTAFVAATRVWILGQTSMPGGVEAMVLAALGYLVGLVFQPLSSRLTAWVEELVARLHGKDEGFVTRVTLCLGTTSRWSMILGKMHGETTMYMQFALLTLTFRVLAEAPSSNASAGSFSLWAAALFVLFVFEVADRQMQRAVRWNSAG